MTHPDPSILNPAPDAPWFSASDPVPEATSPEPAPTAVQRVVLLDLDNCPGELERLAGSLDGFSRIVACHGTQEPKISLRLVPLIIPALQDGRLEIIPATRGGRNAADFALAFHAGRLASELPETTEFVLVSKDRDLDHVVDQLQRAGRKAERLDGATRTQKPESAIPCTVTRKPKELSADPMKSILTRIADSTARPSKRKTLKNALKQWLCTFSDEAITPETIIHRLVSTGSISFDPSGGVIYHESKLHHNSSGGEEVSEDDAEIPF